MVKDNLTNKLNEKAPYSGAFLLSNNLILCNFVNNGF